MSGLDNLLNQIRNTAEEEANARLNQARQQAEELIQNKKDLAEKEIENIKLKTDRKALEILEKAKSAAALQKRNAVLSAKQQIIESLLKTTLDKLNNLEDEAYFQIIRKMVSRYALSQDGQIIFSEKDKNRFPADFEEKLNQDILSKGGSLKISSEIRSFDGGFVLVYGDIEVNCTFTAMLASKHEILQDKINRSLLA
ncbi:MAG: V-type ATP synthase subunit E [Caldicoprobacterales bacterium]|jgi:V/A-type H+-transporting ATPase subunit E